MSAGQIFSGRYPRRLEPTIAGDGRVMYDWTPPSGASDVVNDDRVKMDLQFSTQWDGLSHYGACFDADETVSPNTSFTTATAPIAMSRSRAPGSRRTRVRWGSRLWRGCAWRRDGAARQDRYEALMRAIQAQDAAVEQGDMLCLCAGRGRLARDAGGDGMSDSRKTAALAAVSIRTGAATRRIDSVAAARAVLRSDKGAQARVRASICSIGAIRTRFRAPISTA